MSQYEKLLEELETMAKAMPAPVTRPDKVSPAVLTLAVVLPS